ncbi:hypothetical protein Rsub_01714 [Raphidocelis subcapitata]|uniref:LysM domain-containing protein n=1 Tax=Raphidocelis subcapitata TaxID=307507 RepID=A0A2V0NTE2_9CHLO|nr:hypothetical protein Rsub_01714 [Raphidocelis subcapitata]|eukprot:GBF88813.1 hypothetical protein Rsub_01714 [Raphidocelis subcapitata]
MQGDVLAGVLSRLEPRELGRARCVSQAWLAAAAAALEPAFLRHWGLASVSLPPPGAPAPPRRPGFIETAALGSFVRAHAVAGRGDSFSSLAIRYGVTPQAIKRLNNVISDHSICSRVEIFVPVACARQLEGRHAEVRYCPQAKRYVIVLLEALDERHGGGGDGDGGDAGGGFGGGGRQARARAAAREAELQGEQLREKMSRLLGRCLRVDPEAALFYIDAHGGDVKAAMSAAAADAAWEEGTAGPIRTAPVQRWIRGDAGL